MQVQNDFPDIDPTIVPHQPINSYLERLRGRELAVMEVMTDPPLPELSPEVTKVAELGRDL
jgi:hypothetical protein